jgi:hypothetical protein
MLFIAFNVHKFPEANKERIETRMKMYAPMYREANREQFKAKRKEYIRSAPDSYLIRSGKPKPPQELIEAMRVSLFIKRKLKEIS